MTLDSGSSGIGVMIRQLRQSRGLSLRQLAAQLDIHFSHLSKIENGRDQPGLSVLHRVGTTQEEREAYLRFAPWKGEKEGEPELSVERYEELRNCEQFILTVCANGYGKLSSAYEYRRTGRGGQGITNIDNIARNGDVVASFPAAKGHQLMLVTDQAKLIRMSLASLRVIGRGSAGLRLFNVAPGEHVVSAARIEETEEDAEMNLADGTPEIAPEPDAVVGENLAAGPEDGE